MAVRVLDVHAHISTASALRTMQSGENWFGVTAPQLYNQRRYDPRTFWTPEQRIADMDSLGVDVHELSANVSMYFYDLNVDQTMAMHRDRNDYVAQLTEEYPDRFTGLAHLPMQDVGAAIEELTRAVGEPGLKGAMIGDHVKGRAFDDPVFQPLWATAERLGAMFMIHQGGDTVVSERLNRCHLPNTIGNLADRGITYASLVFGGVMECYPGLRVCLCHGGGYVCYGIGRTHRGWQVRPEARVNIDQPPSVYLGLFYYDCLTHSETGCAC